ncbi:MAG: hypothetical protein ABIW57_06795 [Polyangia bacterium]
MDMVAPQARPRRTVVFVVGALLLLGATTSCRGGCARERPAPRPVDGVLGWFPAETQIVVAIDFARLRATPLWGQLAALAQADPQDQALIAEIARRTGFDPLRQIDSIIVAFPEEARNGGAMGVVLHGQGLEQTRLVAYARDQVAKQGDDLFSFRRDGRTLWATRKQPTVAGFFADDRTFVFGAGGWAEKMAALGGSALSGAEQNPQLVHLVERARVDRSTSPPVSGLVSPPLWAAAIVPADTRAALASDPALASGGGITRLALGVDIAGGLRTHLVADLGTRPQAEAMAAQVTDAVRAARRSPQVLLMGLGPYLDGIAARTSDVTTEITVNLSQAQVTDGVERLRAFLTLARQPPVPGFPHP